MHKTSRCADSATYTRSGEVLYVLGALDAFHIALLGRFTHCSSINVLLEQYAVSSTRIIHKAWWLFNMYYMV